MLASAIYVTSGSSATLDSVRINDLYSPQRCQHENSGIIVGQQGGSISILNSNFTENDCSYIYSDRTPVQISNSRFQEKCTNSPYIHMKGSVLSISDSIFSQDSVSFKTLGHGVKCDTCSQVVIKSSTF